MGVIKSFREFINEEVNNSFDIDEKEFEGMPEEFTGDPDTDPYLAAAIYKHNDDKVYVNNNYVEINLFEPYKKAQKEGNRYYDIWKSLINWIKSNKDSELQGLTVAEKDRILLSTFKSILQRQTNLNKANLYSTEGWKVYNYNRCKDKWEKYTEMAWKFYPNKKDEFKRSQFRRERYENFIRKEGIEKYAKSWIPQFSRSYQV